MNLWRYLGITLFLIGGLALVGSAKLPVYAGGKDKDAVKDKDKDGTKDKDAAKDKEKDGTKDKDASKDKSKDKDAAKDKDAGKDKDGAKDKGEVKTPPPVTGGKLEFKAFSAGKAFYTEQKTTTEQVMQVMQQKVTQKQTQTFIIEWTPKGAADKDGNWTVEQKIVGVKLDIDIGGNKISYDSTAKNPKNPMTDFFEQMTKQTLTFTIGSDLSVKKVEGRDKFIQGLSDINPQMKSLLGAILSEKALTKMAEPTWYAFPAGGDLSKGKWTRTSDLDLGPIGKYETTFNFTSKGTDKDKAKIEIATSLKYSAPSDKAGLPFVIKEAKLSSESGSGEAVFDVTKGRFDSSSLKMKLVGDLTIEVGNMTTTVNLTQDQTATSTTLDALPDAWKSAAVPEKK